MRVLVREAQHAYIDGKHERAHKITRDLTNAAEMIVKETSPGWFDEDEQKFILNILILSKTGDSYNEVQ